MGYMFKGNKNGNIVRGVFTYECVETPLVMFYRVYGYDMINYGVFEKLSFRIDIEHKYLTSITFKCATGDRIITRDSDMYDFYIKFGDSSVEMPLIDFYAMIERNAIKAYESRWYNEHYRLNQTDT